MTYVSNINFSWNIIYALMGKKMMFFECLNKFALSQFRRSVMIYMYLSLITYKLAFIKKNLDIFHQFKFL